MKKVVRILVAESVPDIRDLYRVMLESVADCIDFARDIPEALAMVEDTSYDVVFLDVGVPELDGLDCAEILNGLYPNLPIVVTTSIKLPIRLGAMLLAHPTNYLVSKPFDIKEMRDLVVLACSSTSPPAEAVVASPRHSSDAFPQAI
ncbi:MAG: response regulator [bacterium]